LIVNRNSPATDTFDDGSARVRARANSSVKAGGVSISAQSAPQNAAIPNSIPNRGRMPLPPTAFQSARIGMTD
jgi:hypothetical protein